MVPRGAGTSLSGGALPLGDGVLLGLSKLNRILDVDYVNRTVTAQPGVTNLAITEEVAGEGFYYAPDPSSQIACTIGGNIAENSGGVHCLKYGLTTNNLMGLRIVTIEGEMLSLGGKHLDQPGYDLLGLLTGSEGLLAVGHGSNGPNPRDAGNGRPRRHVRLSVKPGGGPLRGRDHRSPATCRRGLK